MLLENDFRTISLSSELSPNIKYLPRAKTTAVNTYLQPVLDRFINGISLQTGKRPFRIMTSSGGLKPDAGFQARDSLLSGPAGGVVGAAAAARRSGLWRVLAFDMGGTSTDVALCPGKLPTTAHGAIADQGGRGLMTFLTTLPDSADATAMH